MNRKRKADDKQEVSIKKKIRIQNNAGFHKNTGNDKNTLNKIIFKNSQNKSTVSSSLSNEKLSLKEEHEENKSKNSVGKDVGSKEKATKVDVSENWKKLIKSGKVKVKDKKKSTGIKLNGNPQTEKKIDSSASVNKPIDVWFDDVDDILVEYSKPEGHQASNNSLVKPNSFNGVTKTVAIDCEMVGVGSDGKDSIVARVSMVNHFGQCIYDKFVKPTEHVTDYRTHVSGIRPADIAKGEDFKTVQKEVFDLLKGRILVGHAVDNDLKVLFLDHPKRDIRDTSRYKPFRAVTGGIPSLKKLSDKLLGVQIQTGEHNSVQDAQATMRLYTLHRQKWEAELKSKRPFKKKMKKNKKDSKK